MARKALANMQGDKTMRGLENDSKEVALPRWVPDAARNYIHHIEGGLSIRAVARAKDCHPSTVMRQIRRFEGRRDDPLVDGALDALSKQITTRAPQKSVAGRLGLSLAKIEQEAKRVLRRLAEPGAVLAAAREMETAVVVRQSTEGEQVRTAVVACDIAQALALKDWISCDNPDGRIARYTITNAGRAELRRLTAQDENKAAGLVDSDLAGEGSWPDEDLAHLPRSASRHAAQESPLIGLSRRRDRDGQPFLARALVAAGERLREDFELVELAYEDFGQWDAVLSGDISDQIKGPSKGADAALDRIKTALKELGPGLGDVALRCCCFLEGMEQTEKKMGWSARSGKIVLRIALERLKRHYEETEGQYGPLIG